MSLRTKMILWYSGLLAAILLIFGAGVYGVMRWALISTADRMLQNAIEQVLQNTRASLVAQFGPPNQVMVDLPPIDAFGLSGMLVQVWNLSTGYPQLMDASTSVRGYERPLDTTSLSALIPGEGRASLFSTINSNNSEWRVLTYALDIWGRRIAIQVATSSQAIKDASQMLVIIMTTAGGGALLTSIIFSAWLSSRALKPITELTGAAARIASADDLKTRLEWDGPMDELGRMTSVFNHMMSRLEHLFSVQQRFVADVSHELRTPLTAIRGNLDLIGRYGMDSESFEAIQAEARRMGRMVDDLLLLARADYGGLKLELEPLDVDTIVSEAYREARVLVGDREIDVRMGDFSPVRINGNADRIKQLLLNLISNAIKFTPDGGSITLSLRLDGDTCVLQVSDTGIGISPEDQERIFDRFYQADMSRARETGEGAGLGLSIAKWIVDAHGGNIGISSTPGKGTTFTIRLPALVERPVINNDQRASRLRLNIMRRGAATPSETRKGDA